VISVGRGELETTLQQMRSEGRPLPKLLYDVPDFHNPTGITLSENRRRKLVDLAEEYDFFI
jgi:2-aminoadipate transaminase